MSFCCSWNVHAVMMQSKALFALALDVVRTFEELFFSSVARKELCSWRVSFLPRLPPTPAALSVQPIPESEETRRNDSQSFGRSSMTEASWELATSSSCCSLKLKTF